MKRTGPLKPRQAPRKRVRVVGHLRIKPRSGGPPTASERGHLSYIASLPCLVCGVQPVTVHHVTASVHGGRMARSHQRTVPLCPAHHLIQHGPRESVEALGHAGFCARYGIDLLAVADKLWSDRDSAGTAE